MSISSRPPPLFYFVESSIAHGSMVLKTSCTLFTSMETSRSFLSLLLHRMSRRAVLKKHIRILKRFLWRFWRYHGVQGNCIPARCYSGTHEGLFRMTLNPFLPILFQNFIRSVRNFYCRLKIIIFENILRFHWYYFGLVSNRKAVNRLLFKRSKLGIIRVELLW